MTTLMDHVRSLDPKDLEAFEDALDYILDELKKRGPLFETHVSVVINGIDPILDRLRDKDETQTVTEQDLKMVSLLRGIFDHNVPSIKHRACTRTMTKLAPLMLRWLTGDHPILFRDAAVLAIHFMDLSSSTTVQEAFFGDERTCGGVVERLCARASEDGGEASELAMRIISKISPKYRTLFGLHIGRLAKSMPSSFTKRPSWVEMMKKVMTGSRSEPIKLDVIAILDHDYLERLMLTEDGVAFLNILVGQSTSTSKLFDNPSVRKQLVDHFQTYASIQPLMARAMRVRPKIFDSFLKDGFEFPGGCPEVVAPTKRKHNRDPSEDQQQVGGDGKRAFIKNELQPRRLEVFTLAASPHLQSPHSTNDPSPAAVVPPGSALVQSLDDNPGSKTTAALMEEIEELKRQLAKSKRLVAWQEGEIKILEEEIKENNSRFAAICGGVH